MKKFIYNSVFFLLSLSIVVFIAEYLLSRNTKTNIELKYEDVYSTEVGADIVVFGNSHAAAINPDIIEETNFTCYNFFMGGCSPLYYRIWYDEVFKKNYPKPKFVIYAVDWAMFDPEWSRSITADIRLVSFLGFMNILRNEPNVNKLKLISNRSFLVTKPKKLHHVFYPDRREDVKNYNKGFFPTNNKNAAMGMSIDSAIVDELLQNEFNILLDNLEKDSIQVIFVCTPEYIPSWEAQNINSVYSYLEKVAEKRNIPFLNYNDKLKSEINYDSTFFIDWIHLNGKGANKFSKGLSEDLNKIIQ
jgi:hypothetical protein